MKIRKIHHFLLHLLIYRQSMNTTDLMKNIESAQDLKALETTYEASLGKKGWLSGQYASLKDLSIEDKKRVGGELGESKKLLQEAYDKKEKEFQQAAIDEQLHKEIIDITTPFPKQHQ